MLHRDLNVQRNSLRLWAMWSTLESENENSCLTSLYWKPLLRKCWRCGTNRIPQWWHMSLCWAGSKINVVSEALSNCDSNIGLIKSLECVCGSGGYYLCIRVYVCTQAWICWASGSGYTVVLCCSPCFNGEPAASMDICLLSVIKQSDLINLVRDPLCDLILF